MVNFAPIYSFFGGRRYSTQHVEFSQIDLKKLFEHHVHISSLPLEEKKIAEEAISGAISQAGGEVSLNKIYLALKSWEHHTPHKISIGDRNALMKILQEYWAEHYHEVTK